MQTILISGGTGLIGKTLVPFLTEQGYRVIVLTRSLEDKHASESVSYAEWNVEKMLIDVAAVQKADYIIHLAGAGVVDKKWTASYKKQIVESRTQSSKLLVDTLRNNKNEVKAIISASAIGWYGEDHIAGKAFTEEDASAPGFLGETCKLWEESITAAEVLNIRVCKIRTGIVLDTKGGALAEFIKPINFGVAGILGDGKQIVSWIHIMDHCRIFLHAIQHNEMTGAYNAVAPNPVSNKELTIAIAEAKKGSFYVPMHVPTFVLKLMLGERSTEILKSTTVSATKLKATGFTFIYPGIKGAIENLVSE